MIEEYPKAIYAPDDDKKMVVVHTEADELAKLEEWGVATVPQIGLSAPAAKASAKAKASA